MPTVPVTRSVTVRWDRPRYELLDARGAILAALSEISPLAGFRPAHDSLTVEFLDGTQLEVDLGEVTAVCTGSQAPDFYRPHVQAVAHVLGASKAAASFTLQHLVGWTSQGDSATAQAAAATTLSGVLTATDCACLIDGFVAGWQYKAEYGVVDLSEIPDRVARIVGRAVGPAIIKGPSTDQFSQVSTFVDSYWKSVEPWDVNLDGGWSVADAVDELASHLVNDLHNQLADGQKGRLRDGA